MEKPSGTSVVPFGGMVAMSDAVTSYPVAWSVARCGSVASGFKRLIFMSRSSVLISVMRSCSRGSQRTSLLEKVPGVMSNSKFWTPETGNENVG